jgi:hypothetical protein
MATVDLINTQAVLGRSEVINSGDGHQYGPINTSNVRIFNDGFFGPDPRTDDGSQRASISGGSITINGVTIGGSNDPDAPRGSLEGLTQTGNEALLADKAESYQSVIDFTDKYLRNSPGVFGTGAPVSIDIAISYQLVAKAGLEAEAAIKNGDGVTVAGSVLTAIDEFEFLDRIGVEGAAGMAENFRGILDTLNPSNVTAAEQDFKGGFHHFGR